MAQDIWEQRDLLSHKINLTVTKNEQLLITAIVSSIINKTELTWNRSALSIVAEAKLQQTLRLRGYELFCNNLNNLPESCQELLQYVADYSWHLQRTTNLNFIKYSTYSIVSNIYTNIFNNIFPIVSSTRHITSTILIIALLVWINNLTFLLYALIVGYAISNCMTLVVHEYWVHQQMQPKNRAIGFIFDYLGHLLIHDKIAWIYAHRYHHQYWKTSKDVEVTAMLDYGWFYYFVSASPVHGHAAHQQAIESEKNSKIAQELPESQFLIQHAEGITIISHLLFLLAFGLSIYVYFLLFQVWIFHKYIIFFNEMVTHYNHRSAQEEKDIPWLFPICCGTAYHKSHHVLSSSIIIGPGRLKYLNIQYYFIKLFYNITAKVPDKY